MKNMCTPIEDQLRGQLRVLKDCHNQLCKQLVEEQEKNEKLRNHHKILVDLTQQLNRSVMKRNRILTDRSHTINKLLNDLYEGIDENYTEALENNDELTIIRAKTELDLITKILDEVDEI